MPDHSIHLPPTINTTAGHHCHTLWYLCVCLYECVCMATCVSLLQSSPFIQLSTIITTLLILKTCATMWRICINGASTRRKHIFSFPENLPVTVSSVVLLTTKPPNWTSQV